jgi:uncharacterized protein (DUF885 family)
VTAVRLLSCVLLLLAMTVGSAAEPESQAVRDLHALFDSAWQRDLKEDPLQASQYGDRRYNALWPDLSPTAIEKRRRLDLQVLSDLARIPRAALPPAERLNYDLFEHEYRERSAVYPFKPYLYALSQLGGVQTVNETTEVLSFDSPRDYEDWVSRLARLGTYVDQNITLLDLAIRERRTQPRVIMERVPGQIAQQIVARPEDSPFYAPFKHYLDSIDAADRERLSAAARRAITEVVVPAYRRFDRFFKEKYLPACRATVGIWDTPDGAAYYQNRIEYHTTTQLTAEEVHQIGLKEVARIHTEMEKIIAQLGFKGGFQDFLTHLRTDPQFYYKNADDLFEAYAATAKKIDPQLVKLFGKLPRMPYGVRPIPMTSAPNTYAAYYQPAALDGSRAGYFYVNLYRPEVRPKYEIEVLTTHEAVPGHHLQISLQQELGEMPMFRRAAGYTAYVEGWALYSEGLGDELGLYTDRYSKFGQLTYEMWRAARLVVDTGIHSKHWTRAQAIEFFKSNAAKTEPDIVNEVDRYISWPGQALAYKIGELKIKALRAEAQQRLGERFSIKEFHDTVLATGAVPLDVLETNVRSWIDKKLQEPHA